MLSQQEAQQIQADARAAQQEAYEQRKQELEYEQQQKYEQTRKLLDAEAKRQQQMRDMKKKLEIGAKNTKINPAVLQNPTFPQQ